MHGQDALTEYHYGQLVNHHLLSVQILVSRTAPASASLLHQFTLNACQRYAVESSRQCAYLLPVKQHDMNNFVYNPHKREVHFSDASFAKPWCA